MNPRSGTGLPRASGLFGLVILVLFALHQDFWLWGNTALVAGLPIGLLYHLGYCVLVSLVLGLLLAGRKR